MVSISLQLLPDELAVCRLEPGAPLPAWAMNGPLWSVTRTQSELSLVCDQANVPGQILAERDWRVFMVNGPLDFSLTGILFQLSAALAQAGVSLFALSTYDTDYILVKSERVQQALAAFTSAGFSVETA
jgi:uncharacterized protein